MTTLQEYEADLHAPSYVDDWEVRKNGISKNTKCQTIRNPSVSTTSSNTTTTTSLEEDERASSLTDTKEEDEDDVFITRWKARLIHENLVDRSEEETILRTSCYCHDEEGSHAAFVLLTGPSGSGKSRLAKTLQFAATTENYFLSGKFDLRRQLQPYAAIVAAFAHFAPAVAARGSVDEVRETIAASLTPEDTAVLVSMIPSLEPLLPSKKELGRADSSSESIQANYAATTETTGGSDGVQRFVLVFRSFLRAVCSVKLPIILLLDDLHWADSCSLDVLRSVIADRHRGLVVIGTLDDNSIWMSPKLVDLRKSCCVSIQLNNMDRGGVRQFILNALNLDNSPSCESLVEIVNQQTGGNLLYMREFLLWAQDSDCLYFRGRWAWNTAAIDVSTAVPRSVTEFLLTNLLEGLSPATLEVIKVGACLGSHLLDERLIEYVLGHPIKENLEDARAHGVLMTNGAGGYEFAHDKFQEATYLLIPESEKELFHLEVGRRLWRKLDEAEVDQHVFVVLSQFEIGKRLVTRDKEKFRIATLCLHAGTKAAKSTSYFCTAAVCLELGISLMGKKGWKEHYALTLALHNAGAEMEMCTANFDRMNVLVDAVDQRARSTIDKVQALGTRLYYLGATDRQQEAIDLGIEVLASLGEKFPRRQFTAHILYEIMVVTRMIKGRSDEQLMRLPDLQDPKKFACLRILQLLFLNCLLVRPELAPLVSMKIVKITLKHGLSPLACVGFSSFGMFCLTYGDIDKAFRFGQLGKKLLESSGAVEYMPRLYAAIYGVIHSWKLPIRDALEPLLRAHRVGLQTGDIEFAHLCSSCYCFLAFEGGIRLEVIMRQWSTFQETMVSNQQTTLLKMALPFVQGISFYMNPDEDPLSYKGKFVDIMGCTAEEAGHANSTDGRSCCMTIAYMFDAFDDAGKWSSMLDQTCGMVPTFEIVNLYFFRGMIGLQLAYEGKRRRKNIGIAKKSVRLLKKWAVKTPHNALDKLFLLKAELASILGKEEKAYEKFTCAIALAKDSGFLCIQALANERLGYHLFRTGREGPARIFFNEACEVYDDWGGRAKAMKLRANMDSMYAA